MTISSVEEEILVAGNNIEREDEFIIGYSSEKYIIKIQHKNNDIILISAKKAYNLSNSIYKKKFKIDDFQKLLGDLMIFYGSIEKIYKYLIVSFNENKIFIKEIINGNSLTLSTEHELRGQDPLIINIKLPEKKCNIDELIENLCNEINHQKEIIKILEKENITIKEENNILKEKMEKCMNIPEYSIDKFKTVSYNYNYNGNNNNSTTWVTVSSWKYVKKADITKNYYIKEYNNNIIIGYGPIPGKCYVPASVQRNSSGTIGIYYNDECISRSCLYHNYYYYNSYNPNNSNNDSYDTLTILGKLVNRSS